jgi:hypothetical protein
MHRTKHAWGKKANSPVRSLAVSGSRLIVLYRREHRAAQRRARRRRPACFPTKWSGCTITMIGTACNVMARFARADDERSSGIESEHSTAGAPAFNARGLH